MQVLTDEQMFGGAQPQLIGDAEMFAAPVAPPPAVNPRIPESALQPVAPVPPSALPGVGDPGVTPEDIILPPSPAAPAAPEGPPKSPVSRYLMQPEVQGIGRGIVNTIAAADAVTLPGAVRNAGALVSSLLSGPKIPVLRENLLQAGTRGAEAAGIPVADYSNAPWREQLRTNIADLGVQAAAGIPGLVNMARTRAAEIATGSLPRAFDSVLRAYMGKNVAPTIVGDTAATVGSATGKTAVDQSSWKDNPVAEVPAMLAGGAGGVTVANTVGALSRGVARAARKAVGMDVAPVKVDPQTLLPTNYDIFDAAAAKVQGAVSDPEGPAAVLARMRANKAELGILDANAPMPSPAALAEDPGLAVLEGVVNRQDPGAAMARQREFASGVRDTIERVAPDGADPSALVARVQGEADARVNYNRAAEDNVSFDASRAAQASEANISALEARVRQLEGREQRVQDIREDRGTTLRDYGGNEVPASQRLDAEIVGRGYIPARDEKNRLFDTAPGRDEELPADGVIAAARDVRARANDLRPDEQLPTEFTRRIRDLEPRYAENEAGVVENVGGPGTALGGDLADTRKYLNTANERAEKSGNFDLASSLKTLKSAINRTIEDAPGYAEANANYRRFADTYRPGRGDEAAKFTREIDRDPTRSMTPPSKTAGRFLQPGQPEKHAALTRMIEGAENPEAGQAAAREYLLADMASKGTVDARTGVIRPDKIRQWQENWGDLSNVVPGFNNALNEMQREAMQGARVAQRAAGMTKRAAENVTAAQRNARTEGQRFADDLRNAQRNTKATEDEINKGALGLVLNSDADKAVAAIMSQTNRTGKLLDEVIATIGNDQQARDGLKAAVRDYLVDKATTAASEKLRPGDSRGPVSQAKLSGIFKEHEKELAKIFSPEEMNTLRAGHKALELANIERLRAGSGSDTAEKTAALVDQVLNTGIGKGVQAALRVKYGMLKAGGLISTARRMTAGVTGGPDPVEVSRLIERAAVDPDLMAMLLGRKMPVGSPAWNKRMNQLLAVGEGARDSDSD